MCSRAADRCAAEPLTDVQQAAALIARFAGLGPSLVGELLANAETQDYYRRIALKRTHPEQGGRHEDFIQLQAAITLVRGV